MIVHTGVLVLHRENLSTSEVNVTSLVDTKCFRLTGISVEVQSSSVAMTEECNTYVKVAALLNNRSENAGLGYAKRQTFCEHGGRHI